MVNTLICIKEINILSVQTGFKSNILYQYILEF